jgi:site-specific recombinase XerD
VHQLAVVSPSAAGQPAFADAELDAARSFAEQEKAAATRRAYRSDFVIFAAWGRVRSAEPLPASPAAAAAFLAAEANAGAKSSTITRRAAAIRYAHRLAGHEPPTSSETVRAVMRDIRCSIGTAKDQKAPAAADLIVAMLKHCPDTLRTA